MLLANQFEGQSNWKLADGAEQSLKPVSAGLTEAEELEKYITIREEVYKKAKEFDSKIISFETAIRRPYFHVQPLNSAELENWTSYLDFIEEEGDLSKRQLVIHLFATQFKEQSGDIPGAQATYQLAHFELPPEIHLDILGTITINVLTWVAAVI
ncbi:hypothetical protein DVH24_000260 [Malus domestica]|uniref:Uncharacterized protein n=1 Tax=Malus domestica TaxID=3750 RepID=A0A498J5C1_MALDO|nr:hypothetical protein DVH24_000260 [Malus domestica]